VGLSRLFWKFFLTFWLTLLVANLVVGVTIWLHRSAEVENGGRNFRHGKPPTFMLGTAASVLEHDGEAAFTQLLRDWQESHPEPIFAVDETGHDLLGRQPIPEALEQARQGIRNGTAGPWRQVERPGAPPLLLFMPEHHRPPDSLLAMAAGPALHLGPPPGEAGKPPQGTDAPQERGREHPPRPPLPWLLIGTMLLASLAFSAFLAWTIVGPIQRLRQGFRHVAAGRLDTRVGPEFSRRRDEIGELGQEFDAMAGQLENLMATQRRLFHDVSHELRSPLARLQAAVGLVHQDPTRMGETLERIERETLRLDELVDELLTLARLDSGTSGPLAEEIDLPALLQSIVDDAAFEAESQGRDVRFNDQCCPGGARVRARADLIGRALENVIRNGVKYTPAGTAVSVAARCADDTLHITVSDQGPGVAKEELEAIFVPFFRGTDREQQRGYGLGLAIARRAIAAHGGRITARNRAEGGLQVDIELPLLLPQGS